MKLLIKKIFKILPNCIKKILIYRSININYHLDKNIVFKIAETKDEIIQALTLLQNVYHDERLTSDNDKLRATIYHALPTTTIIIAKIDNEVVGTISHIADSPLGLPLEKIFNLSKLRKNAKKLCEVGSLAIKKDLRNINTNLSLYYHLMGYAFKFSKHFANDDYFCLACHPRAIVFYDAIANFYPISNEVKDYNFVGNSPASALYLDHEITERELEHRFEWGKKTNKFFELCFYEPIKNYQFPSANPYCFPHKVLTPEELNDLFFINSNTLNKVDIKEKTTVSNIYHLNKYKNPIDRLGCSDIITRKNPRYVITMSGHLKGHNTSLRIVDISREGLQIIFSKQHALKIDSYIKIELKLENYDSIAIEGIITWTHKNTAGVKIKHINPDNKIKWDHLLEAIESKFYS